MSDEPSDVDVPAGRPSERGSNQGSHVHGYQTGIRWVGSTGAGYDAYDRHHSGWAEPASARLALSADPAFRGDADLLNTEQLLVLAASSCQMLSFLAIAARAHIDVVSYADDATGDMPDRPAGHPMSIERVRLRPQIEIRGDVAPRRVVRLVELAHHECYVANSLRSEITVEPTITLLPAGERS